MNYYNEIDPFAAQWLRNLIAAGLIPQGHVDERSIELVQPNDLAGFSQCHFFAGIGGWSYALRLAGWPENRPVWTGSCPCQPFSVAGKGAGVNDPRHLWPQFERLIAACKPPVVFGEQVASKAGRDWLDGVRIDLEGLEYEVGAADLCAAGVGTPHIRQRLYWLGNADHQGLQGRCELPREYTDQRPIRAAGEFSGVAHDGSERRERRQDKPRSTVKNTPEWNEKGVYIERSLANKRNGYWDNFDLVHCTDGKTRRIEPGSFPLAHGIPARMGRLRGYGNAIVPQVAAEVIGAYMDLTA